MNNSSPLAGIAIFSVQGLLTYKYVLKQIPEENILMSLLRICTECESN